MNILFVVFLGIVILSSNFVFGLNIDTMYKMDKHEVNIEPSNLQTNLGSKEQVVDNYGIFTENRGQWDDDIYFIANTDFGHVGFGKSCIFLNLLDIQKYVKNDISSYEPDIQVSGYVMIYTFQDANLVVPLGLEENTQRSNYIYGNDPNDWVTGAMSYSKLIYHNLWPGIDLVYYFTSEGLKYDFLIQPGARVENIKVNIDGSERVNDQDNELIINLPNDQKLVDSGLVVYYSDNGEIIESMFIQIDQDTYSFKLEDHDTTREIIIDPLIYSTFVGDSGWDNARSIDFDNSGNAFVTGHTTSTNFPTTVGAYDRSQNGDVDAFVFKLNPMGTGLIYSTFVGGSGREYSYGITVNSNGYPIVTGGTTSSNFPTTGNAYDTTHAGSYDVFAFQLNSSGGGLAYSTYIGGSGFDMGRGIELDSAGFPYIVGNTSSTNFPTTTGAYDRTYGGITDVFVTKVNRTFDKLIFSTYIGGTTGDKGYAIAVDGAGNSYITGYTDVFGTKQYPTTPGAYDTSGNMMEDVIVSKLNASGDKLLLSTLVSGSSMERGYGIDVDTSGYIYVAGWTRSSGFPTTNGAYQTSFKGSSSYSEGFILKLNITFDTLIYSTFLGDTHNDEINGLKVDNNGVAHVVGSTGSTNFPVTADAENGTHGGGILDAFFVKMNASGNGLLYSTFRGGGSNDYGYSIAISKTGDIFIAGVSSSSDFPTTTGAYSRTHKGGDDCIVFKFSLQVTILPSPPRNLNGDLGKGYVDLTWNPPVDYITAKLTGYNLYRGRTTGGETLLTSLGNITAYNDTAVTVGQDYYYYITALNVSGESYPSNEYHAGDFECPRIVVDHTPTSGTTGEDITFQVEVSDNLEVNNTWVEYWFGSGSHSNTSMFYSGNNLWTFTLDVPRDSVEDLNYVFHAEDIFKNWNQSQEIEIQIIDNDRPIYIPYGDDPFVEFFDPVTTGDNYTFRVYVVDYVQLYSVWFEYWYGNEEHDNISMIEDLDYPGWWKIKITVPHSLENLHFIFNANDTSNNWNQTVQYDVSVVDNDKPHIWPELEDPFIPGGVGYEPGPAYTGDEYAFIASVIDNIAVDTVWVEYWYGYGDSDNNSLISSSEGKWSKNILADHTLEKLHFKFHANDTSNNWNISQEYIIDVIDNDNPEFGNDTSPATGTTGDPYSFSIQAKDNIEIYNLTLFYKFGTSEYTSVELSSISGLYSYKIAIPEDSLDELNYYFISYDTSDNWNRTSVISVLILDNDPPSFWELSFESYVNTGDSYQVKTTVVDNIGVNNVSLNYWFGSDNPSKIGLIETGSMDEFTGEISIPKTSLEYLYLKFSAMDISNNLNISRTIMIMVKDNIPPVIQPIQDLLINSGDSINISVIATDNIGVVEIMWENTPFTATGFNLSGKIDVAGDYKIKVTVSDAGGNSAFQRFNLTVKSIDKDKDGSSKSEESDILVFIILIIVIIVVLIVIFFLFTKRKTKDNKDDVTLQQQPMDQSFDQQSEPQLEQPLQPEQSQQLPPEQYPQQTEPYPIQGQDYQTQNNMDLYQQPEPTQQQQQIYQPENGHFAPEQEQPYEDSGFDYGVGPMESETPQTTQEQQQYFQTDTISTEQPGLMQPDYENVPLDNAALSDGTGTSEIAEPMQMEQNLQQPQESFEQPFILCPNCSMQIGQGLSVCPNCSTRVQY
jgi:hypothetical protein